MDRGVFGIDITKYDNYGDYINVLDRFSFREREAITPDIVIRICDELANQIKAESILVSSFKSGMLSNGLSKLGYKVSSLIQSESEKQIADRFSFDQYSSNVDEKFDLICADIPFDSRRKEYVNEMVDIVALAIKETGFFVMTFPASVSYDKKYKDILEYLENSGLFANAIIDMPKSTYAPTTNIDTKIIIFQRTRSERRFIAKISEQKDVKVVISNYANDVAAKNYTIGTWVERDNYFDLQDFEAELTYRKEAKNYGGTALNIEKLSKEVNRPDKENNFKDIPNAIYIPKVGLSQVVDSIENFTIKPQNYIQVVLDEDIISTQYACFFLNSEQGIANRKLTMKGYFPSFNHQTIKELVIALPDGDGEQRNILETNKQIEELRLQLDALEARFFKKPSDYKMIQKSLKDINNVETLSDWVETLPFPLASILRRYLAENLYEKKQETLFLFFEAYAIYNACILLSIINNNVEAFECNSLFETTDIKYYTRSTFGSWVTLNKIITNYVLGKIGGKNAESAEENPLLGYFKTDNFDIIKVLCNRDINKILYNASDKRNKWKGHTGISSEQVCKNHVLELEQYLNQLRYLVRDAFEEMELIRATSCINTKSGAENSIEILVGSNALFFKETYVTSTPLVSDVLYLKMKDTQRVIELLPLIVFKSSPSSEKNACYFYSRNEDNNTLYVSYHYEQQPEESEPGHEALEALTRIIPERIDK